MDKYKAVVTYKSANGDCFIVTNYGFSSVKEATNWMIKQVGYAMLHWAEINESGLDIRAEVCDMGELNSFGFNDCYEIHCGM